MNDNLPASVRRPVRRAVRSVRATRCTSFRPLGRRRRPGRAPPSVPPACPHRSPSPPTRSSSPSPTATRARCPRGPWRATSWGRIGARLLQRLDRRRARRRGAGPDDAAPPGRGLRGDHRQGSRARSACCGTRARTSWPRRCAACAPTRRSASVRPSTTASTTTSRWTRPFTPEDLAAFEAEMQKVVAEKYPVRARGGVAGGGARRASPTIRSSSSASRTSRGATR